MRFMVIVKANPSSEAGVMPSEQLITDMGTFNEELIKAGALLAAEGLQPSAKGTRIQFSGSKRAHVDGPFANTRELISGFWLLEAKSKEEVLEWFKRCPNPADGGDGEIEIRPVMSAEDFGDELTPKVREQEERLHTLAGKN